MTMRMSNTLGMNLLLWGTEIDARLFPVLDQIKEIGFGGVEVPIFNTNPKDWEAWRIKLDELGLARVAVTINGPGENLITKDSHERRLTIERNKRALDCAKVLGSDLLTGPFHSALGVFTGQKATEQEKQWAQEGLWELSEYAQSLGITLGLEYLNRFESYLVSCTDELIELVNNVNHPACKIMFDTFHANIEEKDMGAAIKKMGDKLVHVQLSENDRGTLGSGRVEIDVVLQALKDINYQGMLSIEAFSEKLSAANIWRKMFESEEQLMRDSFAFLNDQIQVLVFRC
jgi:D-psicose/D-tagatose/L-ribulose 3-epimerase